MSETSDSALLLRLVCDALLDQRMEEAQTLLRRYAPFSGSPAQKRQYSEIEKTRLFLRDGFIDRYSGKKLVFGGILRLISFRMSETFPYHPNWKMESCHPMYWELTPTLDHLVPIARGGQDRMENWITTSMLSNSSKANWTLDELGWTLLPPGDLAEWDGLVGSFVRLVEADAVLSEQRFIRHYYRAAKTALEMGAAGIFENLN